MKRARNEGARAARVRGEAGVGVADAGILDDLLQRLAFERMLARLYRALDSRLGHSGGMDGGPARGDLSRIEAGLLGRCQLLEHAIEALEPGRRTPTEAPRLVGTCEFAAVLADPRYGFAQCIEAILVTELLDNHAWAALVERLEAHGFRELAAAFAPTLEEEQAQLALVRRWIRATGAARQSVPG